MSPLVFEASGPKSSDDLHKVSCWQERPELPGEFLEAGRISKETYLEAKPSCFLSMRRKKLAWRAEV